jgi:Trehalose receptor
LVSSIVSSSKTNYNLEEWVSLSVVLYRVIVICLSTASVNDKATETLEMIDDVPVENYTEEIKSFRDFVTTTKVSLSGLKLFSITKGLILTVSR